MSKKHVKMVLYGEPGVGKSTFVSKAPNPFFVCSDPNFEWLGLPDENHVQVNSWEEAKKVFGELATPKFDWVETVAVDLLEDLFKWCEYEYCKKNRIEHLADQGYGKGYDSTRNEFFIEIGKLLNLNKNVILIMHGLTTVEKDRRGVEHTKYVPSNRLPDKVCDMIEGRVRYFIRCYMKGEENEDGLLVKRRYLSIIPKENEFGISRGLDEATTPSDIELDWNVFASVVGLDNEVVEVKKVSKPVEQPKEEAPKEEVKEEPKKEVRRVATPKKVEVKVEEVEVEVVKEEPKKEEPKKVEEKVKTVEVEDLPPKQEVKKEEPKKEEPKPVEQPKQEEPKKELSAQDKIAAIRAKVAALKNKQ